MAKPCNLGRSQNKAKTNILARLQSGDRDCWIVASNLSMSLIFLSFSFMVNILDLNVVLGPETNSSTTAVVRAQAERCGSDGLGFRCKDNGDCWEKVMLVDMCEK